MHPLLKDSNTQGLGFPFLSHFPDGNSHFYKFHLKSYLLEERLIFLLSFMKLLFSEFKIHSTHSRYTVQLFFLVNFHNGS